MKKPMLILSVIAVLVLTSSLTSAANWVLLGQDSKIKIYYDPNTVEYTPLGFSILEFFVYLKEPDDLLQRSEYDCQTKNRMRVIGGQLFLQDGTMQPSNKPSSKWKSETYNWTYIPSGTQDAEIAKQLFDKSCK